jgi:hypothetical protein
MKVINTAFKNFILTVMYTWHMGHTSDLHVVTTDI